MRVEVAAEARESAPSSEAKVKELERDDEHCESISSAPAPAPPEASTCVTEVTESVGGRGMGRELGDEMSGRAWGEKEGESRRRKRGTHLACFEPPSSVEGYGSENKSGSSTRRGGRVVDRPAST